MCRFASKFHFSSQINPINEANNRRLSVIRAELHQLTREKVRNHLRKKERDWMSIRFLLDQIQCGKTNTRY